MARLWTIGLPLGRHSRNLAMDTVRRSHNVRGPPIYRSASARGRDDRWSRSVPNPQVCYISDGGTVFRSCYRIARNRFDENFRYHLYADPRESRESHRNVRINGLALWALSNRMDRPSVSGSGAPLSAGPGALQPGNEISQTGRDAGVPMTAMLEDRASVKPNGERSTVRRS